MNIITNSFMLGIDKFRNHKYDRLFTLTIIILFIVFIILRLFVSSNIYFIAVDEARYLGLAKNFPYHTLYGNNIMLQHMPLYPYLIAILNNVLKDDVISGSLVSFVSSILFFYVCFLLLKEFNLNKFIIVTFMFFLTFSNFMISLSNIVFKEMLLLLLFTTTLLFFLKYLKSSRPIHFYLATISGVAMAYSSDMVIFLLINLVMMILVFSKESQKIVISLLKLDKKKSENLIKTFNIKDFLKSNIKPLAIIFIIFIAYSSWLILRVVIFETHELYLASDEGLIENLTNYNLRNVLSPFSMKSISNYHNYYLDFDPLQIIGSVYYLIEVYPFNLPVVYSTNISNLFNLRSGIILFFVYLPFIVLFTIGLLAIKFNKLVYKIKLRKTYTFFLLSLISWLPLLFLGILNSRYITPLIIPIYFFVSLGLFTLFSKFSTINFRKLCFFTMMLSLLFLILFLTNNHFLFFTRTNVIQGDMLALYLKENNISGAIFISPGYSMEQAYLSDSKLQVYGLPFGYDELLLLMEVYNSSYVILGNHAWDLNDAPSKYLVRTDTNNFKLIATVNNTYPSLEYSDFFEIYKKTNTHNSKSYTLPK